MLTGHMQTNCLENNSKANNNTNSKLSEELDPAPTDKEFCVWGQVMISALLVTARRTYKSTHNWDFEKENKLAP